MPDVSRVTPLPPGAAPAGQDGPGHDGRRPTTRRAHPRLRWYADAPARRSRQLVGDVLVLLWCALWLAVGLLVHQAVSSLVSPTLTLAGSADRTAAQLERGGDGLAGIPLVGDDASAPLRAAATAVTDISTSTTRLAELVGDLALLVGVLVPLTPVALVLLLWLPARLRWARRAGAAQGLLDAGADPQLFALRALTTQPLPRLAAVSVDPVGDWRRGDPEVTARLASLELDRLGLRPR